MKFEKRLLLAARTQGGPVRAVNVLGGGESGREYIGMGVCNTHNVYTAMGGDNRSHTGHIYLKYRSNWSKMTL